MADKKFVIELIGGVGSGKSRILALLESEYQAKILKTDETARELEEAGEAGYIKLVEAFGIGILDENDDIDREKLSSVIFADDEARLLVNSFIHPLTWERIHQEADDITEGLIVVESAIPDPDEGFYDEIWYVSAPVKERISRLERDRGYSDKKCRDIMNSQLSDEDYRALADEVIDNEGTFDETRAFVENLTDRIMTE